MGAHEKLLNAEIAKNGRGVREEERSCSNEGNVPC